MTDDRVEWEIFVDESGDFDRPDDVRVVAGVAFGDVPGTRFPSQRVRDALAEAAPGVPWPFHASVFGRPSGRAWALGRASRQGALPPEVAELARDVSRVIEGSDDHWARALSEAVSLPRREPDYATMAGVDRWLEIRHPELAARLRHRCGQDREGIARVLRTAVEGLPEGRAVVFIGAFLLGSGPSAPAPDEAARSVPRDDYLAALGAFLERAVLSLRSSRGASHRVHLHVARRGVVRPGYGRTPLTVADVGARAREALSYPHLPSSGLGDARLRIVVDDVRSIDSAAHPGLVLADFAANTVYRGLRAMGHGHAGYDEVASELERALGIPIRRVPDAWPDAGSLSTMASAGASREHLRRCLAEGRALPLPDGLVRWDADQVGSWMHAIWGTT
ncbi:MAG: hypothetical protein U0230_20715 [Polyangiales bacterium]